MIEIKHWMDTFLQTLNATFGDRIFFIGLQGSYGRGEATQSSLGKKGNYELGAIGPVSVLL